MNCYHRIKVLHPPPPPSLSKENVGVWMGWSCKGDREVAREAAAKGHMDLVLIFLSVRKKISPENAQDFFKKEVLLWVDELLERKQIFRATHILNNINLDPNSELEKVFYRTTKKDIREYIGDHLEKLNRLDESKKQLWHFLDLILKNSLLVMKTKLEEESLKCLLEKEEEWKHEVAGKLFLRTHDPDLIPFLNPEVIWKQLLAYNDTHLLKSWINITYTQSSHAEMSENLLEYFHKFPVNESMLNATVSSETSTMTRHLILNEFSKFGVFCEWDKRNLTHILVRLKHSHSLRNTFEIITGNTSNLHLEDFLTLLIEFCLERNYFHVINVCVKNYEISSIAEKLNCSHLNLIYDFRELITGNFQESLLGRNILNVCDFLHDDLNRFLSQHPMVFLALIFFTNGVDFFDKKPLIMYEKDFSDVRRDFLENHALLKNIHQIRLNGTECNITYYDLLEKHLKIDAKNVFKVQFSHRRDFPHFNDSNLVEQFGYSKLVNHLFHVKQSRPSIAAKTFLLNQFKRNSKILECDLKSAYKKVFRRALGNFENPEITSSCVAFLEMIGIDSEIIRNSLKAAHVLLSAGIDIDIDIDNIKEHFLNIYNDPNTVQNLLENVVVESIDFENITDGFELVTALKRYEIVFKMTQMYNLPLPVRFLTQCAVHNSWLPFLLFAQIKNYPLAQIKTTLQSLKNPNLLEHVKHSVMHDIQEESNVLMRDRDSRKYFLSRIGVRRKSSEGTEHLSGTSSTSSLSSASSIGSEFLEIDGLNVKATLLQTLIRCHNSTDPPRALLQASQLYRNPLLAVFATSYEPDSLITNWLTWVAVSSAQYETFTNFDSITTCAPSVTDLLNCCMKNRFPKTLLDSFKIFVPENPLKIFLEFLNLLIDKNYDETVLISKLSAFKSAKNQRRSSVLNHNDYEMTYLKNKIWIESTSLKLLASTITYNCDSLFEQIQLVHELTKLKIEDFFMSTNANCDALLQILRNIHQSKCDVKFDIEAYFNENELPAALERCIDEFVQRNVFDVPLKLAKIIELPRDGIVVKKCVYDAGKRTTSDGNFWKKCDEIFENEQVSPWEVLNFYDECSRFALNAHEKYLQCKLSHRWARNFALPDEYELEKRKFLSFFTIEDSFKNVEELVEDCVDSSNVLYKEMLENLDKVPKHDEPLTENDKSDVENVIKTALNKGNFFLCLKLEKMFGCVNTDLEILKLCHSLAEGLAVPYNLTKEQNLLLNSGKRFRRFSHKRNHYRSPHPVHLNGQSSNNQTSDDLDNTPIQDTLLLLHSLTEKLTDGSRLAFDIFMRYRASVNMEIPYHVVVSNHSDHMKMLKDALEDDCMNKFEVVHDFVHVYRWTKEQIADFICEQVITAASKFVQIKSEHFTMWDLCMDQQFHLVLQLVQDNCSALGHKIFKYACALHGVQMSVDLDFRISELALVVQLLIASHDSFTSDCNMEGISLVLKKCQVVIAHLLTLRSWKLIVRLLTGIGRYTEMNYVFQILKENDQFEFLLRKGSRKDNALKLALLEYLKKYCPDNRELYKIVALHFTLFSEVAMLWEREAQSVIKNLIAISKLEMQNNKLNPDQQPYVLLSNTDGTKLCLNKAMENYTHATEFHLQGEKVAKAMNAAKQAELLALQTSLLKGLPNGGTAVCVLNANPTQVASLISTELSFDSAFLLSQAYNHQPDWSAVLYERCVLRSDPSYLQSFLRCVPLTDALVYDVTRKFLAANLNGTGEIAAMKAMVTRVASHHVKYRLASELGFTDVLEDLIAANQLAFLKDTVWKRGYRSQNA